MAIWLCVYVRVSLQAKIAVQQAHILTTNRTRTPHCAAPPSLATDYYQPLLHLRKEVSDQWSVVRGQWLVGTYLRYLMQMGRRPRHANAMPYILCRAMPCYLVNSCDQLASLYGVPNNLSGPLSLHCQHPA